jgi:hypothetical protein
MAELEEALALILSDSTRSISTEQYAELFCTAEAHRVHLLLADRSQASNQARALIAGAALTDAIRQREATRVFDALAAIGVTAIVIKGAALGHLLYRASYLRPRTDIDILIAETDLPRVMAAFAALGYARPVETPGALIAHQCHFDRVDANRVVHAWDVHWKIVNALAAADALRFDEMSRSGIPVPGLGPNVIAPSFVHSLLLACVHRVTHHADAPDLLWLLDTHLLAARLTDEDWRAFVSLARARGVWSACASTLRRTHDAFSTSLPAFVDAEIERDGPDRTTAFLKQDLRQIDVVRSDFAALGTWSARWTLIREHVFPPPSFIAARYGVRHRITLPWWYLRRMCVGGARWFRPLKP